MENVFKVFQSNYKALKIDYKLQVITNCKWLQTRGQGFFEILFNFTSAQLFKFASVA